jgi:hypothetical protein
LEELAVEKDPIRMARVRKLSKVPVAVQLPLWQSFRRLRPFNLLSSRIPDDGWAFFGVVAMQQRLLSSIMRLSAHPFT